MSQTGGDNKNQAVAWTENTELVMGGMNLHQDLHFANFYLRASLPAEAMPDYPGYSRILALYENGSERYFISAAEAERTSRALIERCVSEPCWLAQKLEAIETHTLKLADAFPPDLTADSIRLLSTSELLLIYRRHNALHRKLYQFARIPEALDRGRPFFSDYLRNCLTDAGVPDGDLGQVFESLTTPDTPSLMAIEQREFDTIARDLQGACPDIARTHSPLMFIPPDLRQRIRDHQQKWGWLDYHGFRNRTLPDETDFMHRLCQRSAGVIHPAISSSTEGHDHAAADSTKFLLRLDDRHRQLFRLYPEIGRVKLFRRFHQLRNFYFLDQILVEMARRLDLTEWHVRCCLPHELMESIERGRMIPDVERRMNSCAVFYGENGEVVFDEAETRDLKSAMRIRTQTADDPGSRSGTPASIGYATGTARLIGVRNNGLGTVFNNGDIAVCEAADPDFLSLIRRASAVLTQQGGVTSHASVVCREIGVPTIVGIHDLLDFVRDGDRIEVDAVRGIVRKIKPEHGPTARSILVPRDLWGDAAAVGPKAANLTHAREFGFRVPPFAVLSWNSVCRLLEDGDDEALAEALNNVACSLETGAGLESLIVRSSAFDEDRTDHSNAGRYASLPCPQRSSLLDVLKRFVEQNRARDYDGAVLLQTFVPAEIGGVSVDGDPLLSAERKLVAEFAHGSANAVTGGRVRPARIVHDHRTDDTLMPDGYEAGLPDMSLQIGELVSWLTSVGRKFGRPTYTEWGFFRHNFWLYQVRGPLTRSSRQASV